ncbi:MAG: cytochrome c [Blastochloris sp.]|nr:cytochrome c [Blastochloris sp.]
MKVFFFSLLVAIVAVVAIAGLRGTKTTSTPVEIFSDMDHQPKAKAQTESRFFADGRSDRLPVSGTIPSKVPVEEPYKVTGKIEGYWGDGIPSEVTTEFLARGKERYIINCAVCHGDTGAGNGITSQYGLVGSANYNTDRLRQVPDGYLYNVVVHGKNNMIGLPHIQLEDRWAIVAYIRVLQRAGNSRIQDVPEEEAKKLLSP